MDNETHEERLLREYQEILGEEPNETVKLLLRSTGDLEMYKWGEKTGDWLQLIQKK